MELIMATTATGWSGLLNTPVALVLSIDRGALERATKRVYARLKVPRKLALVLNGTVAGSNATVTEGRVQASVGITAEQGGKRVIETNTLINRVTTAADKTRIDNAITKSSRPGSYPQQPGQPQTAGVFSGNGNIIA
jgi:hypothetical protein